MLIALNLYLACLASFLHLLDVAPEMDFGD